MDQFFGMLSVTDVSATKVPVGFSPRFSKKSHYGSDDCCSDANCCAGWGDCPGDCPDCGGFCDE